jgi:hypothetical protein
VAVVYAAVDWTRCGRTDPISAETLRELWPGYLPLGVLATDAGFKTGLAWALKPVAGTIALLQRTGTYRAYDYIVRFVLDQPDTPAPANTAWTSAIQDAHQCAGPPGARQRSRRDFEGLAPVGAKACQRRRAASAWPVLEPRAVP